VSEEDGLVVGAEDLLHRVPNLEQRAVGLGGLDDGWEHVLSCRRRFRQFGQRSLRSGGVPGRPEFLQLRRLFSDRIVDLKQWNRERGAVLGFKCVDANRQSTPLFLLPLLARGRLRDPALQPSRFQRAHDATDRGDLRKQRLGLGRGCR